MGVRSRIIVGKRLVFAGSLGTFFGDAGHDGDAQSFRRTDQRRRPVGLSRARWRGRNHANHGRGREKAKRRARGQLHNSLLMLDEPPTISNAPVPNAKIVAALPRLPLKLARVSRYSLR